MHKVRLLIGPAAALALSACAGRALDTMLPVAVRAPGTTEVPLLVATTRRATPTAPGTLFSGERSRRTSFSRIDVSIPPSHRVGDVEWPDRSPGDPARNFVTLRADSLDRAAFRAAIKERVKRTGERHVLVFVHGYNNQFDDAVFRFAQIVRDSGVRANGVLFTWPSRGRLLAYPYDRESATYSRDALEALLDDLSAEPSVSQIDILAHSMGTWVTLEALRQQAIRRGRVGPKIRNLMLAAPDVDVDVARTQVEDLGPNRPNITLFVSQDDRALAFSHYFWGSSAQLGAIDPAVEPYRSALERSHINVVDLTRMNSGDPLNHAKFAQSPEVVRSIGSRLAAGQTITAHGPGLGEGVGLVVGAVAQTAGAAVTAAVAVPVAVVDPETRRDLDDHLKAVVPGLDPEAPSEEAERPDLR